MWFVLAVDVVALTALLALPPPSALRPSAALLLLVALAAVCARPVRFASLRTELTVTHPFLLCALAIEGPLAAVVVALTGVLAAAIGRRRSVSPLRLAFNLGAVLLATSFAAAVYSAMGGVQGGTVPATLPALAVATAAYFLANTGLVSAAVAMEGRGRIAAVWKSSFRWTAVSYFMGLTLAAAMLVILERLGPWGLVLGIPPAWLLLSFYRSHRERMAEKQRRIDQVEKLNRKLEGTVLELRHALAHVKKLQGLLPICMHCKSIRDDQDTWHRLESYLAEHSEARFTHSVCRKCQEEHYPAAVTERWTR
jgi:hypothetical protein